MIVYEIRLRLIIASRSYGGPVILAPLHPQHKTKKQKKQKKTIFPRLFRKPKNQKTNFSQTLQKMKNERVWEKLVFWFWGFLVLCCGCRGAGMTGPPQNYHSFYSGKKLN